MGRKRTKKLSSKILLKVTNSHFKYQKVIYRCNHILTNANSTADRINCTCLALLNLVWIILIKMEINRIVTKNSDWTYISFISLIKKTLEHIYHINALTWYKIQHAITIWLIIGNDTEFLMQMLGFWINRSKEPTMRENCLPLFRITVSALCLSLHDIQKYKISPIFSLKVNVKIKSARATTATLEQN